MARQYYMTRGGDRVPMNPDCGIVGCERAEYRAGLCRKHFDMIPLTAKLNRACDMAQQIHELAKAKREEAVALVQAELDRAEPGAA